MLLELLPHCFGRLGDLLRLVGLGGLGDTDDLLMSLLLGHLNDVGDLAGEVGFHFVVVGSFWFEFCLLIIIVGAFILLIKLINFIKASDRLRAFF